MILTDVITLAEAPKTDNADVVELLKPLRAVRDKMGGLKVAWPNTRDDSAVFDRLMKGHVDHESELLREFLAEHGTIPNDALTSSPDGDTPADHLSMAMRSPRVELSEIRRIADKLGFVAVPFDYVDQRSWDDEDYQTRSAIEEFARVLSPLMSVYVLAPVVHYSIRQHIDHEKDLPIYAGLPVAQTFSAVTMMVPVFRSMATRLDEAEKRARKQEKFNAKISKELDGVTARLDVLERQVQRQHEEAIRAKVEMAALKEEMASRRRQERERFVPWEPMMFAFPHNKTIEDDAIACVGPCWGPDFPEIVAAGLNLTIIGGQRDVIEKANQRWGRIRSRSHQTWVSPLDEMRISPRDRFYTIAGPGPLMRFGR